MLRANNTPDGVRYELAGIPPTNGHSVRLAISQQQPVADAESATGLLAIGRM